MTLEAKIWICWQRYPFYRGTDIHRYVFSQSNPFQRQIRSDQSSLPPTGEPSFAAELPSEEPPITDTPTPASPLRPLPRFKPLQHPPRTHPLHHRRRRIIAGECTPPPLTASYDPTYIDGHGRTEKLPPFALDDDKAARRAVGGKREHPIVVKF